MPPVTATVTAYDIATAYGAGVDACWEGLRAGHSAITDLDRFATGAFISGRAATMPGLDAAAEQSLVMQMLAPMLASARALVPGDTTVILATTTGEIDLLERNVLQGSGGTHDSRPGLLLDRVCSALGTAGPAMVISSACASATSAIAQAAAMVRTGHASSVLVVSCDSVTEFVFSGFSTLMALDAEGARPFDKTRKGLTPGEAAGYMLVMSDSRARAEGRPAMGEIAGWGMSNDANHMTGPSRDGAGLAAAVSRALASAGIDRSTVASVCAHGTGTPYNDAMEMKAFRLVFGGNPVPTYSVKGAIGHTMGAAGLVEAVVTLESLRRGAVPPTVNTAQVDEDAVGWVSPETVPTQGADTALTTNSGFGGVNAALVLKRECSEFGVQLVPPKLPSEGGCSG